MWTWHALEQNLFSAGRAPNKWWAEGVVSTYGIWDYNGGDGFPGRPYSADSEFAATGAPPGLAFNAWTHVAVARRGGAAALYVNGARAGSATAAQVVSWDGNNLYMFVDPPGARASAETAPPFEPIPAPMALRTEDDRHSRRAGQHGGQCEQPYFPSRSPPLPRQATRRRRFTAGWATWPS